MFLCREDSVWQKNWFSNRMTAWVSIMRENERKETQGSTKANQAWVVEYHEGQILRDLINLAINRKNIYGFFQKWNNWHTYIESETNSIYLIIFAWSIYLELVKIWKSMFFLFNPEIFCFVFRNREPFNQSSNFSPEVETVPRHMGLGFIGHKRERWEWNEIWFFSIESFSEAAFLYYGFQLICNLLLYSVLGSFSFPALTALAAWGWKDDWSMIA